MSAITPDETLLGLLASRPQHGYELLEHFRASDGLGEVWNLSTSQLYAVLKRLESQKLVVGKQIEANNAPTRTEYSLTEAGGIRLLHWLEDSQPSASIRRVRVEFLSRLYTARLLNVPTQPIVRHQKHRCQQARDELVNHLSSLLPGVGRLAVELHITQLDAVLNWIDRCEMIPKYREDTDEP